MNLLIRVTCLVVLASILPRTALGQVSGGESGFDASLEAITPSGERRSVGLAGENPANIARYILAANGGARNGQLSPDGKTIAFTWKITGEPQLWTIPAAGGQPRQLTFGRAITFFEWAPEGNGLIYGMDDDGNEQEAYFLVDSSGINEKLVLPSLPGGFRVFGDFRSESEIVFSSTERNKLDFDIYRADLDTGKQSLVYEGKYGFFVSEVSPNGRLAVVNESVGEDSDNLYLLEITTGELKTISKPERRASHARGGIAWKSDSSGFYLASNRDRNFAALMFYEIGAGFKPVVDAEGDIENVRLCGNDRYLAWTVNAGGYSRLSVRDLQSDKRLTTPALPEGVYSLHSQLGNNALAITINGWKTPGDIFVWDLAEGAITPAFSANLAGLDPRRLVRPRNITLPARDGVTLQGLLYLPNESSQAEEGPPPVVFIVHGGPTAQARPAFSPDIQYLTDRGLAAFAPNVRGSTGFGHTYVTLDDRENRLDSVRDLVDMLKFLGDEGLVDAKRAAVVGGSYGGYAVNAVLASYPGNFLAGVALFGVSDWVTALEIASPALKASDRIEYGDIREPKWKEFYKTNSPINLADRINVPVLYSHGVNDPRVDISETETMVRTLRSNDVEAPFIRFSDEGHGWKKLPNQLFYYQNQVKFLEEKLGLAQPTN